MGLPYATFSDPDGSRWLVRKTAARLPGATDARTTSCESVEDRPVRCRAAAAPRQADQELARTGTPGS
jgi:hypothetical protein